MYDSRRGVIRLRSRVALPGASPRILDPWSQAVIALGLGDSQGVLQNARGLSELSIPTIGFAQMVQGRCVAWGQTRRPAQLRDRRRILLQTHIRPSEGVQGCGIVGQLHRTPSVG